MYATLPFLCMLRADAFGAALAFAAAGSADPNWAGVGGGGGNFGAAATMYVRQKHLPLRKIECLPGFKVGAGDADGLAPAAATSSQLNT
jgi:hypothetical protein